MWTWLNQNSGGINVVLTVVLAAATLRYVILTAALLRENIALREATNRPAVAITTSVDDARINIVNLVIQNWGAGSAFNLKFVVRQQVIREGVVDLSKVGVFRKGLRYLAPNQRIEMFLANAIGNLDLLVQHPIEIDLTYDDAAGKHYTQPFSIDFGELENISRVGEPPIHELAEAVKKLQSSLDGVLRGWTKLQVVTHTPDEPK